MAIEVLTIKGKPMTLSHALWKRYGRRVPGLVEATLSQNPGLAAIGAILPVGTKFNVTSPAPTPKTQVVKLIRLTGAT